MKHLLRAAALCALLSALMAAPALADGLAYIFNPDPADRLNLRTAPSAEADSLGKYYSGTQVELLGEEKDGYVRVRIEPLEGYMDADYLTGAPVASAQPWLRVSNASGSGVNIRTQPSASSAVLRLAPNGERVTVLAVRRDEWLHVAYNGCQGFASASLLAPQLSFHRTDATGSIPTVPPAPTPTPTPTPSPTPAPTPSPTPAPTPSPDLSTEPGHASSVCVVFNPSGSIVHLRELPDANAAPLCLLPNGTQVELLDAQAGWGHVRAGESTGYVPEEFLVGT